MCVFWKTSAVVGFRMAFTNVFSFNCPSTCFLLYLVLQAHIAFNLPYSIISIFPSYFHMKEVFLYKTKHKQTNEHLRINKVHPPPLQKKSLLFSETTEVSVKL